jgi:hypothetical protein
MRFSTLALAGAFMAVAATAHADDVMANTYANTIHTKNTANGQTGTLLFNADGSFTGSVVGPDGKPIPYPGKWAVNGGNICLTPMLPPNTPDAPGPSCSPVVSHNLGDSWTVTNDQGLTYEVSLSAGR